MSEKLYTEEELNKMTVAQLRALAKEKDFKYVSKTKKNDLVSKLANIYKIESYKKPSSSENDDEEIIEIPIIEEEISKQQEATKDDETSSIKDVKEESALEEKDNQSNDKPSPAKEWDIHEERRETVYKSRGVNPNAVKKKKRKPLIDKTLNRILLPIMLIVFVLITAILLRIGVDIFWIGVQGYKPLPLIALILAVLITRKYIKSTIKNGTAKDVLIYYHNKMIEELESQKDKTEDN